MQNTEVILPGGDGARTRAGPGCELPDVASIRTGVVRIEGLRFYNELVLQGGGDPDALLELAGIDPELVGRSNVFVPYRQMIHLLEITAHALNSPDFGLRLAQRQHQTGILGPLDVAMRNAATIGDAFRYAAKHSHAYCSATQLRVEDEHNTGLTTLQFDILLNRIPNRRQAVEQALLLCHLVTRLISGDKARGREIWFMHEPEKPEYVYRQYFGVPVRFCQPFDAIMFSTADMEQRVICRDQQLYEMAVSFIDMQFPSPNQVISTPVRMIIRRMLARGTCSHVEVADALGIHPRTLQRRLREEGQSFEAIKDYVRREAAMRYLSQTKISLTRVAEMLGYSETSVLTRSCQRWFNGSPKQIRKAGLSDDSYFDKCA